MRTNRRRPSEAERRAVKEAFLLALREPHTEHIEAVHRLLRAYQRAWLGVEPAPAP